MEKFIEMLGEALEREGEIKMSDRFRDYDEWNSLAYLSLIALMDEVYDVQIEEKEFSRLITVEDLYKTCIKK